MLMPSVENFYWVLYQNLLQPAGINCWYYYPWGTTQYFVNHEFQSIYRVSHLRHVLFHFDQEPIWADRLPTYDLVDEAWQTRNIRILANSEHSLIKQQVLRNRQMQDWYYFYHGFAALDWYRDLQYVDNDIDVEDAFLCFNHNFKGQRAYRLDLVARLIENDCIHMGKVSLHATHEDILCELDDQFTKLSDDNIQRVKNSLVHNLSLPKKIDNIVVNGNLSAHCGVAEHRLWQSSLFHIVNETVFYEDKLHLTEKIFKPIVSKRPFLLVGAYKNLSYLKKYGFRTFNDWIDESYDDITDPNLRIQAIVDEIIKISRLSRQQLHELHNEIKPILEYNYQHFFTDFRQIIVDELVENFEVCLRIWNNGRVDGHEVPIPQNLRRVRNILLQ